MTFRTSTKSAAVPGWMAAAVSFIHLSSIPTSVKYPPSVPDAAPKAAPTRTAHPQKDYDELTVAQISEQASSWRRPNLEAALEHEQAHANRKGAIAAL